MWKNKHVIIALIMSPVLAIITYFAVDYSVSERPHAAIAGASSPLLARSNCRYASGECDLENGDFKLTLTREAETAQSPRVQVVSTHRLHGAKIALAANADDDVTPLAMAADDDSAKIWSIPLIDTLPRGGSLRLVVMVDESNYFAEVPTTFFEQPAQRSR